MLYNADGTIFSRLKTPILVSDLAQQRKSFINYKDPYSLYFDGTGWTKIDSSQVVTFVRISFNRDWWESRVLDLETGELEECISSGRR